MRSVEVHLATTLHDDILDKILEATATTGQDVPNRVNAMALEVGLQREDQRKLSARVANTEIKLKEVRPSLTEMEEKVSFLTAAVQRRRASFVGIKKCLHQAGLTYSLLFPARLKVIASIFFTEPTDSWDWVELCRYEVSKSSSLNVHPDRPQRGKRNRKIPQERAMDRVKGAPTPARLEQKQALTIVTALWMDEGRTITQIRNEQHTDSETEASVIETLSEALPEATPQTANMLL
ncbi:hypothetical protein NDU88_005534 [Pleurodeles waltl]|uniref:Uncharacterized protein n=1 Tax=Pleurodeles waltl TaxID=8319 RepID=A0AAV7UMD9_PLEWA|nr:hypothetical protein NDU88_005534 [Pleurodeles waltl]